MAKIGIRTFREQRLPPHTFIPAEVQSGCRTLWPRWSCAAGAAAAAVSQPVAWFSSCIASHGMQLGHAG
jgi:hypothetical protein